MMWLQERASKDLALQMHKRAADAAARDAAGLRGQLAQAASQIAEYTQVPSTIHLPICPNLLLIHSLFALKLCRFALLQANFGLLIWSACLQCHLVQASADMELQSQKLELQTVSAEAATLKVELHKANNQVVLNTQVWGHISKTQASRLGASTPEHAPSADSAHNCTILCSQHQPVCAH